MVQSETYYMITINQHPDCEVPLQAVEAGLIKYAKKYSSRWMLALEEGSLNGKPHFHLDLELIKPIRKDALVRAIYTATKILKQVDENKRQYAVVANGTKQLPHKSAWEVHAIAYVEKDNKYTTNMDEDWIQEQVAKKKLKNEVEQKSIYVCKPKFWKLYREELMKNKRDYIKRYRDNPNNKSWVHDTHIIYKWTNQDPDLIRHEIMSIILKTYTPLWLKTDIISLIIEYQEGLHMYHEHLEGAVNRGIMLRNEKPLEIEIVARRV